MKIEYLLLLLNSLLNISQYLNLQNDTSRVNVSVEDVNEWEPRFRHPRYEFHATTLREGSIVGELTFVIN